MLYLEHRKSSPASVCLHCDWAIFAKDMNLDEERSAETKYACGELVLRRKGEGDSYPSTEVSAEPNLVNRTEVFSDRQSDIRLPHSAGVHQYQDRWSSTRQEDTV